MSYTFSSPSLPPGFSIVGSKLLASANAPAFAGTITIAITDGFTTVNKVIAIDRRPTTVSALVTQIVELVSGTGSNDSFAAIEVITKTVLSEVGFEGGFSFFSIGTVLSIVGASDTIERDDQIVVNGVVFEFSFVNSNYDPVATFALAFYISVFRRFGDSTATNNASIGCTASSAATFRSNLLAAVRLKFNRSEITLSGCGTGQDFVGGPVMIEYSYLKN